MARKITASCAWMIAVAAAAAMLATPSGAQATPSGAQATSGKWQRLNNCRLVPGKYMDGDSFHVRHGDKTYIFRLYFVDAPETDRSLDDRIAEQAAYWNISETRVTRLGRTATRFTERTLKNGFNVYTQWEDAGGASELPRYYGIVKVGKDDLSELLVEQGLARVYGATTPLPDGTSIDSFFQRLRQLEARAKRRKAGGWSKVEDVADAEEESAAPAEEEQPPPAVLWANVPVVAFLRAEAFINTERFEEAEEEMRALLKRFPDHNQLPRIEFYLALSLAMQERFAEAVALFREWQAKHPNHIMAPEVGYWLPISMFYAGDYPAALPLFEAFAAKYPMSVYAPEAAYRAALCRYAMEDYETCAKNLAAWVAANPEHYFRGEALVTLGDALAAIGELERAKEAYLSVGKESGPFYYMALTQAARVFKALGTQRDFQDMASAFARFIQDNPQSDNIIDAAYQAGWALRQTGRPDEARRLYWRMIERHGDNPSWEGFDAMLKDLSGMYSNEERESYSADLQEKQQKAVAEKRLTLAARLAWAEAQTRSPEDQWRAAQAIAIRFKRGQLGAETLAWIGELHVQNGKLEEGLAFFVQLLQTSPESRYAGRAHVQLAERKLEQENYEASLDHAESALAVAGEPRLIMEATFLRARSLEGLQRFSDAITDYNTVLSNRSAPRALKPEALLGIAACLEAQGRHRHAIPYYQRVYVLYGAYDSAVARAYLRSGKAFEQIKDIEAAVRTYRELLDQEALSSTAEALEARQRLAKLGS